MTIWIDSYTINWLFIEVELYSFLVTIIWLVVISKWRLNCTPSRRSFRKEQILPQVLLFKARINRVQNQVERLPLLAVHLGTILQSRVRLRHGQLVQPPLRPANQRYAQNPSNTEISNKNWTSTQENCPYNPPKKPHKIKSYHEKRGRRRT